MAEDGMRIISALVEDRPGVLFKVASLIRRRGFNIATITVGGTEKDNISRITITMRGNPAIVEQLVKQLSKIPDVIKISELDPEDSAFRELALVKVSATDPAKRSDILNYINIFRARVIDASKDSLVIEVVGQPRKIQAFLDLMKGFGIIEMAKTGIVALSRGARSTSIVD
ncbi:MAG: acetolactate synthase small subunit [Candidatus Methanosuratincola sp.]|uniref:Acetolactate synthase small subunit n=2 Tax=Candidatus Methanosuratincola (ex Vanwonterghem et al. 2016) TaxID=1915412 RepID=A0A444L833_METS7|nr:acetolactate synthase small subunit [Candidatus Methanosuratincola sp.]RWX73734.1 MAG: Acetolactate synthase small subunit [Candidatus Methanosuratincola subterraneus]